MEQPYYYMKAKTMWTFAHWFQDAKYWEDSLLIDGAPPSLSLVNEEVQPEIESSDRYSESGFTVPQTSHDQGFDTDNSFDLPLQPSTETIQDISDGVARSSTSWDDPSSSSQNLILPSTSLQKKLHVCDTCKKTFRDASTLAAHLRTHSGDKPFKCTQCGKFFSQHGSLKRHEVIHTESKWYSCAQCSYRCPEQSSLTRHLRTHTGEKHFTCGVCENFFSDRSSLIRHQRIHSKEKPYTCSTCGISFATSSAMKRHLLTHTKEKPHKCEHCGKYFTLKSNLKVHLRTHRGETPYSCQTCGKTFAYSNNRNKHSGQCASQAEATVTEDL